MIRTRAAGTSLAALLLGAALTACGSLTPDSGPHSDPAGNGTSASRTSTEPTTPAVTIPTGRAGTPRPGLPTGVDGNSADAVTKAALTTMWTIDTTIDTTQYDATARAFPYLTTEYAAKLKDGRPRSAPGAQWQTWTDHTAWTTVTLSPTEDAGRPADTPTTAYRQYTVTATPHGTDGWTGDPIETTAFVTLTRNNGPWKISSVQTQ